MCPLELLQMTISRVPPQKPFSEVADIFTSQRRDQLSLLLTWDLCVYSMLPSPCTFRSSVRRGRNTFSPPGLHLQGLLAAASPCVPPFIALQWFLRHCCVISKCLILLVARSKITHRLQVIWLLAGQITSHSLTAFFFPGLVIGHRGVFNLTLFF